MKALLFNEARTVEVTDVPDPIPGPGEIVVSVAFAGICGSDLKGVEDGGRRTPPLIMGHEIAGMTPDGRRVAVNAMVGCGNCDICHSGNGQRCRERKTVGVARPGGFAEHVAVPERSLVELPDSLSLEAGALVEPLAVVLRAWRRSKAEPGHHIGVIGSGNIGLLSLEVARHFGAVVDVADTDPARRAMAEAHEASRVFPELDGEYEVVFDAVGTTETHRASVDRVLPGGTAVWIGAHTRDPGFDAIELFRHERSVVASLGYSPQDFTDAADLAGELRLDWSWVRPLADGAEAFLDLLEGRSEDVKVLLQP